MRLGVIFVMLAAVLVAVGAGYDSSLEGTKNRYDYTMWAGKVRERYKQRIKNYEWPRLELSTNKVGALAREIRKDEKRDDCISFRREDWYANGNPVLTVDVFVERSSAAAQERMMKSFAENSVKMSLSSEEIGDRCYVHKWGRFASSAFVRNNVYVYVYADTNVVHALSVSRTFDADLYRRSMNIK